MVDARQRGVITGRVFLSFHSAGLRVDTIAEAFAMLNWDVLTIVVVALRQISTEHRFAGQFLFDFFEASSAGDFRFDGAATSAGDFGASGGVSAPTVAGRRVKLFGFEVTIRGASGSVETGGAFATASFDNFSVARALFVHFVVQSTSRPHGGNSAVHDFLLTGT